MRSHFTFIVEQRKTEKMLQKRSNRQHYCFGLLPTSFHWQKCWTSLSWTFIVPAGEITRRCLCLTHDFWSWKFSILSVQAISTFSASSPPYSPSIGYQQHARRSNLLIDKVGFSILYNCRIRKAGQRSFDLFNLISQSQNSVKMIYEELVHERLQSFCSGLVRRWMYFLTAYSYKEDSLTSRRKNVKRLSLYTLKDWLNILITFAVSKLGQIS